MLQTFCDGVCLKFIPDNNNTQSPTNSTLVTHLCFSRIELNSSLYKVIVLYISVGLLSEHHDVNIFTSIKHIDTSENSMHSIFIYYKQMLFP